MGDAADDAWDRCMDDLDAYEADLAWLKQQTDQYLFEATSGARKPIVVGIRRYFAERNMMTEKQRAVLAMWILSRQDESASACLRNEAGEDA